MNRVQMLGPPLAIAAIVVLALAAISIISRLQSPAPLRGREPNPTSVLAGRPAPDWGRHAWNRTGPLTWEALRGKTVVVHLPAAAAPDSAAASALDELARRHARRGLTVIAVTGADSVEREGDTGGGGEEPLVTTVVDSTGSLRAVYGLTDARDAATVIVNGAGVVSSVLAGGIGGSADEARSRLTTLAEIELAVERLLDQPEKDE